MLLSTSAPNVSQIWLLLPVASFMITSVLAVVAVGKTADWIDERLFRSLNFRRVFFVVSSIVLSLSIGAIIELADFSEVASGSIKLHSLVAMTLLGPFTVTFGATQYVLFAHEDKWDDRLEKERTRAREQELLKEEQELLKDEARNYRDFMLFVDKVFRNAILERVDRMKRLMDSHDARPGKGITIPALLMCLAPNQQIILLVHAAFSIFNRQLEQHAENSPRMRVALFEYDKRREAYRACYNYDGASEECIASPSQTNASYFRVAAQTKCLAVWVAVRKKIRAEPDASDADRLQENPFHHFDPDQRDRIKSILCIPLGSRTNNEPSEYVMSIDTNIKGFFSDDRMKEYQALADGISDRLQHEAALENLMKLTAIQEGGESNGNDD